jgi:hypothetical protein
VTVSRILSALALLATATAAHAFDGVMPVPPPGQIFAPGPKALNFNFQGPKANPSSIGDFNGTVALVYLKGRATGGDGHSFLMQNDMRIMTGTYRAADGSEHRGTFAFV